MKKRYIRHASELVTCKGSAPKHGKEMSDIGLIKDGAVIIHDGKIVAVGTTEELDKQVDVKEYEVIDATGKTVMPGFVDSHTHFIFGGYRADEFSWRLKGDSYMSIMERGGGINATVVPTREATEEELMEAGEERLNRMLEFGVTTVEGKSGYGMDCDTELKQLRVMKKLDEKHPVDIVRTFLGPHSVLPEWKGKEREFIEEQLRVVMPKVKEENLAEFADIFTDHLLKASDEGIRQMRDAGVISTLLPATAFSLKEEYAPGRKMIDEGCAVAIASDLNPGSCFTNSIPLLVALGCIYMNMSIEEVITALTINGAAAVDRADTVGSLEPGKQADIVFLKFPSIHFMPYHTGINLVETVIKKGETVYHKEWK